MRAWHVQRGPFDDEDGSWWLVCSVEENCDGVLQDVEVRFSTLSDAVRFMTTLEQMMGPVEIEWEDNDYE